MSKRKHLPILFFVLSCAVCGCQGRGCTSGNGLDIHEAAGKGELERVRRLIAGDPDTVHARHESRIPLHYAAWHGHKDVAELLIEGGSDVNAETKNGSTPLHWAVRAENWEICDLLLESGARTDIYIEAGLGRLELVRKTIRDNRALLNQPNSYGATALHWAAGTGRDEVVKYLIAEGAQVNARFEKVDKPLHARADTPLHWAAQGGHSGSCELLMASGADVNVADDAGRTPLHVAAARGRLDVVEVLVGNGAEINARDGRGRTPLTTAESGGYNKIARFLKSHGGVE